MTMIPSIAYSHQHMVAELHFQRLVPWYMNRCRLESASAAGCVRTGRDANAMAGFAYQKGGSYCEIVGQQRTRRGNSSFGAASMEDRARTRPRASEDTGHGMGALSILMRYLF